MFLYLKDFFRTIAEYRLYRGKMRTRDLLYKTRKKPLACCPGREGY